MADDAARLKLAAATRHKQHRWRLLRVRRPLCLRQEEHLGRDADYECIDGA
jgi:hypothetical protein